MESSTAGELNDAETNRNRPRFMPDGSVNPLWLDNTMDYIANVVGDNPQFRAVRSVATVPAQQTHDNNPIAPEGDQYVQPEMTTDCPGFDCPNWGRARWVKFRPCSRCSDVPLRQREESHRRLREEIEGAEMPAPIPSPAIPNNHAWNLLPPNAGSPPPRYNPLTTIPVSDYQTLQENLAEFPREVRSMASFVQNIQKYVMDLHDLWGGATKQMNVMLQNISGPRATRIQETIRDIETHLQLWRYRLDRARTFATDFEALLRVGLIDSLDLDPPRSEQRVWLSHRMFEIYLLANEGRNQWDELEDETIPDLIRSLEEEPSESTSEFDALANPGVSDHQIVGPQPDVDMDIVQAINYSTDVDTDVSEDVVSDTDDDMEVSEATTSDTDVDMSDA